MTIQEFNKKYKIQVEVLTLQEAKLIDSEDELTYGDVEEFLENYSYVVIDRDTDERVLTINTESDESAIYDIRKEFNITA